MTTADFNSQILDQKSSLKNFALSLTRNNDDALDLVQDTFMKAVLYKDKFADSTNLKAWLFTIMKNTFINSYRRAVKTREIMQTGTDLTMLKAFKNISADAPEIKMNAKEIIYKIDRLDDQYKIPFTRYYNGFKYQEIAAEMNLPIGTVKSRIFIARKMLMEQLKGTL
jgi:RNA polymerase sigma-70 factor, ECF subfamily